MMVKHTKYPSPTWLKLGLMTTFLLIIMASSAAQTLAGENFGVEAQVEIEVERATQHQIVIDPDPYLHIYITIILILGFVVTLLFVKKARRVKATIGALFGGEKLE